MPSDTMTVEEKTAVADKMDNLLGTPQRGGFTPADDTTTPTTEETPDGNTIQADGQPDGTIDGNPSGRQDDQRQVTGSGQDGRRDGQERVDPSPTDARLTSIEQTLVKLGQTLEVLSAPPAPAPAEATPKRPTIETPSFLKGDELEDILTDPAALDKKLQQVYEQARNDSRAEFQAMLEEANASTVEETTKATRETAVKDFFDKHTELKTRYLDPFLRTLSFLEAQHPGWEPVKLLAEAKAKLDADRALFLEGTTAAAPSGGGNGVKAGSLGAAPTPSGGRIGAGTPARQTLADEIEQKLGSRK